MRPLNTFLAPADRLSRLRALHDQHQPAWHHGELNPLPNVPGIPTSVLDLVRTHTDCYARWVQARHDVAAAEADLARAKEADADAAAQAVLAGKQPPTTGTHTPRAQDQLDRARRAEHAHRRAVATVERQLINAVEQHAPTWRATLDREAAAINTQLASIVEQLTSLLYRRALIRNARYLLGNPDQLKSWLNLSNTAIEAQTSARVREILQLAETGDPAVFHAIQPASPPPEPAA